MIQDDCNKKEMLHCKIIRDADKLDIFYVILDESFEAAYPSDRYVKDGISKEIKEGFIKDNRIDYSKIKSCVDLLVGQIAYVFDINYIHSLEEIKRENYIEKLIKKFDAKEEKTKKDLEELKDIAEKYIEEKIKEGEICLKNY
jgi:hypothetical protein